MSIAVGILAILVIILTIMGSIIIADLGQLKQRVGQMEWQRDMRRGSK